METQNKTQAEELKRAHELIASTNQSSISRAIIPENPSVVKSITYEQREYNANMSGTSKIYTDLDQTFTNPMANPSAMSLTK
jgi:hypothetical protein